MMHRLYYYEENQSFVFGVFQKAPQRTEIKSREYELGSERIIFLFKKLILSAKDAFN